MPASYKVVGKFLIRAQINETVMGMTPDGRPVIMRQPGELHRIPVGTVLTDVRPEELAAFPDRFELVAGDPNAPDEALTYGVGDTAAEARAQGAPVSRPQAQTASAPYQAAVPASRAVPASGAPTPEPVPDPVPASEAPHGAGSPTSPEAPHESHAEPPKDPDTAAESGAHGSAARRVTPPPTPPSPTPPPHTPRR